jgi:protein-tyrosine phosphatase
MTWVTDDIFVAGGEFVVEEWAAFRAQSGVSAIVTVTAEKPGIFVEPLPWAWLWLPVAEEGAYTLDALTLGVRFIEAALAAGRTVLLHGPKGLHRTRPLVAAHLLANGKSLSRVLREIEQKPWLPPYRGEIELLKQFMQVSGGAGAQG